MLKMVYYNYTEINLLQQTIMHFVIWWVHEKKTPVPLKEIISNMRRSEVKDFTAVNAINSLLRKGYIRRAVTPGKKTYFVQCRTI
jgi:hypothetical protein